MSASVNYAHLEALSDRHGIFEHALLDEPRREHGYCVDDVARALIVVVREPVHTPALSRLGATYLRFLESALDDHGRSRNRMNVDGVWTDEPSMGDWWGRNVWALGVAATRGPDAFTRSRALRAFRVAAQQRGGHIRTSAFAALGAANIAALDPSDRDARRILGDLIDDVPSAVDADWPWPEEALGYANGSIPEALIAAGDALKDPTAVDRGLDLLRFLVDIEIADARVSVVGSRGRRRGEASPLYDQQPIEVAAIADACARAHAVTEDPFWLQQIELCWGWFTGDNDSATPMFDPATGAGFDGLELGGRNENRGAESTLAALSTRQQALRATLMARA
jgi:hypothetical protein